MNSPQMILGSATFVQVNSGSDPGCGGGPATACQGPASSSYLEPAANPSR